MVVFHNWELVKGDQINLDTIWPYLTSYSWLQCQSQCQSQCQCQCRCQCRCRCRCQCRITMMSLPQLCCWQDAGCTALFILAFSVAKILLIINDMMKVIVRWIELPVHILRVVSWELLQFSTYFFTFHVSILHHSMQRNMERPGRCCESEWLATARLQLTWWE